MEDGLKWTSVADGEVVEKEMEIKLNHIEAFHTFDELVWVTTRDKNGDQLKPMSFAIGYNMVGYLENIEDTLS